MDNNPIAVFVSGFLIGTLVTTMFTIGLLDFVPDGTVRGQKQFRYGEMIYNVTLNKEATDSLINARKYK